MGPDLVFGTPDDVIMQFGVDAYDPRERYQGVHDTINTMAFALSTGRTAAAPSSIAALAATPQTAAIRVFLDARQVEFSTAPPNTRVWSLVDSPVDEEEASLPPS